MSLVLVTGAAGWIGRHVCNSLRLSGAHIAALDIVAPPFHCDEVIRCGIESFRSPPERLKIVLSRASAIIHCAGRAHRPNETPDEVRQFQETNVEGTRALIAACEAVGPHRVIYVSTIAGYDWDSNPDAPCTEDAPMRFVSAYSRTKIEAEMILRESELDWRVVRLATVFGDGDKANFAKLVRAIKQRRFFIPGNGAARKSIIPVEFAGQVLAELALIAEPRYRLLNVAMPATPTLREVCDTFSSVCDFPRALRIPLGVLRGASFGCDVAARLGLNLPLTSPILQKLTRSTVVDAARLYETLPGIAWPSFADAVRAASAYYRSL